ncbi:DNA-binding MarR family transcriptional regulator [Sphingomonas vulcanisoli]|uniref:DNA-binding MarR family transcriptional regulator n=1 Tax=Sphingomonas vulcanisoli TaxID=1658060 RepID=A0ABX0TYA7_9SPHN|nr:MarR family winged helix-turn-helix transcriptional regulator [Sphingomonas vulcanisoli]NIJ09184.1 DNA-binding MarR family transcriptional regulator [Sphingomonas vulcanisoli]
MAKGPLRLEEFLPFRLSYTSNLVSDRIADAYMALFGLRIPEWRVIAVVAEQDGISQLDIGARTRMDKVTVSRAAIALSQRGLLARQPHGADKRSHLLILSEAGRALYAEVAPKALELEAQLFAGFSQAELDAFTATLRRIDAVVLSGT